MIKPVEKLARAVNEMNINCTRKQIFEITNSLRLFICTADTQSGPHWPGGTPGGGRGVSGWAGVQLSAGKTVKCTQITVPKFSILFIYGNSVKNTITVFTEY